MTRDAAAIMAAQNVEHYEIATYGRLTQLVKTLICIDIAGDDANSAGRKRYG